MCRFFLPESLKLFLISIISTSNSTLRIASLGQAIMQGSRPRGIQAPFQIGLGVQLHTKYASRNLLDSLHSMGFCCSGNLKEMLLFLRELTSHFQKNSLFNTQLTMLIITYVSLTEMGLFMAWE